MYGRDAYVQVVSKGFYLPHGHRVATIKVTERQFRPHRDNPAELYPTAYLSQRIYQICKRPRKSYAPALGQPFTGREIPAQTVRSASLAVKHFTLASFPDNDDRSHGSGKTALNTF
jgi:hypothetical protein